MNKIRLNTIGEVVSKQSSSGGSDLQIKSVTIIENGSKAIIPDAGFGGMSKVVVNADVNTLQGLDFSEIYDAEHADELNQYYKDGIEHAEEIKRTWDNPQNLSFKYQWSTKIVFFPEVDTSNAINMQGMFDYSGILSLPRTLNTTNATNLGQFCRNAQALFFMPELDNTNNTNLKDAFSYCHKLKKIILKNCAKVTDFAQCFFQNKGLISLYLSMWKQANISVSNSNLLSPESIHYIIQNAVDVADGATARTLTLHATAKTNWQNSEYYQQDLAVLQNKGITIA